MFVGICSRTFGVVIRLIAAMSFLACDEPGDDCARDDDGLLLTQITSFGRTSEELLAEVAQAMDEDLQLFWVNPPGDVCWRDSSESVQVEVVVRPPSLRQYGSKNQCWPGDVEVGMTDFTISVTTSDGALSNAEFLGSMSIVSHWPPLPAPVDEGEMAAETYVLPSIAHIGGCLTSASGVELSLLEALEGRGFTDLPCISIALGWSNGVWRLGHLFLTAGLPYHIGCEPCQLLGAVTEEALGRESVSCSNGCCSRLY